MTDREFFFICQCGKKTKLGGPDPVALQDRNNDLVDALCLIRDGDKRVKRVGRKEFCRRVLDGESLASVLRKPVTVTIPEELLPPWDIEMFCKGDPK